MSATEWTALTALAVAVIGAIGTIVLQVFQMYFTYKRDVELKKSANVVEQKIDQNTAITRAGTTVAANNAITAAVTAQETKTATNEIAQSLEKKLNGGVDSLVATAIKPIQTIIDEHSARIDELNKYVHDRNHDILDALHKQSLKLEVLLTTLRQKNQ